MPLAVFRRLPRQFESRSIAATARSLAQSYTQSFLKRPLVRRSQPVHTGRIRIHAYFDLTSIYHATLLLLDVTRPGHNGFKFKIINAEMTYSEHVLITPRTHGTLYPAQTQLDSSKTSVSRVQSLCTRSRPTRSSSLASSSLSISPRASN